MKTLKNILLGILIAVLLLLGGWAGYKIYPAYHPCPDISSDTIYVYDTILHYIPDTIPYYIVKRDTIIYRDTVFKDIDTAEILKDYYALHHYTRNWEDSLLTVTLKDVITENKPIDNVFTYKLLKPQTIVNNVINTYSYSRYVTIGMDIPLKDIKYVNIELLYVTKRFYGGIGYNPNLNSLTAKGGITMFKMK